MSKGASGSSSKHKRSVGSRRSLASAMVHAVKFGRRKHPEAASGSAGEPKTRPAPTVVVSADDAPVTERTQTVWLMPSKMYRWITVFYALDVVYLALNFHYTPIRSMGALGVASITQGIVFTTLITYFAVARLRPVAHWTLILHVTSTFVLFIVDFAWLYWSFSVRPHACMNVALTKADSFYFTLTTFTTVGYGDINPVSEHCREIVSMQMIGGVALLVVVLSVLITRISEARPAKQPT